MKRTPIERQPDGTIFWIRIFGCERRHVVRRKVSPIALLTACGKRAGVGNTWESGYNDRALPCSNCKRAIAGEATYAIAKAIAS